MVCRLVIPPNANFSIFITDEGNIKVFILKANVIADDPIDVRQSLVNVRDSNVD